MIDRRWRTSRGETEKKREAEGKPPLMPGYGISDANSGKGLLEWSWATERLMKAHNYWLATTRPDGRPHCMPVWGIWLEDGLF